MSFLNRENFDADALMEGSEDEASEQEVPERSMENQISSARPQPAMAEGSY